MDFRYTIQKHPDGEALTESEIEQKLLKTLGKKGGDDPDALWDLARFYQHMRRIDEAAAFMNRFIGMTDDSEKISAGFLSLGQLEERRCNWPEAVSQYRKALSYEPCSPDLWYFIHNNLGFSLNQLGEYDAAIPYLKQAIEIEPRRSNAYKNLGLALEALGELSKAAEMFIAATQVNASDPRALGHLLKMMKANPALTEKDPDLLSRADACLTAAKVAKSKQPDLKGLWEEQRNKQKQQ